MGSRSRLRRFYLESGGPDPFLRAGFRVARSQTREKLNRFAKQALQGIESAGRTDSLPDQTPALEREPDQLAPYLFGVAAGSMMLPVSPLAKSPDLSSYSFITALGTGFGAGYPKNELPPQNAFSTGSGLYLGYWRWTQFIEEQTGTVFSPAVDRGLGAMIWLGSGLDGFAASSLAYSFTDERRPEIWRGLGFSLAFFADFSEAKSVQALLANSGPMTPFLTEGFAFGAFQRERVQPVDDLMERTSRALSGESAVDLVHRLQSTFSEWE